MCARECTRVCVVVLATYSADNLSHRTLGCFGFSIHGDIPVGRLSDRRSIGDRCQRGAWVREAADRAPKGSRTAHQGLRSRHHRLGGGIEGASTALHESFLGEVVATPIQPGRRRTCSLSAHLSCVGSCVFLSGTLKKLGFFGLCRLPYLLRGVLHLGVLWAINRIPNTVMDHRLERSCCWVRVIALAFMREV